MSTLRSFTEDDLDSVAELFVDVFRDGKGAPHGPREALREMFFDRPGADADIRPHVYAVDGRVAGFIGILPLRIVADGTRATAAIASNLMLHPDQRHTLAGARLFRAFTTGPQDLSFGESVNRTSHAMWTRTGGELLPIHSLDWVRVLRPTSFALSIVSEKLARSAPGRAAGNLADRVLRSVVRDMTPEQQPGLEAYACSESEFVDFSLDLAGSYAVRPDWAEDELRWHLRRAWSKPQYGQGGYVAVRDRSHRVRGVYLHHARPGARSRLLCVLTRPGQEESVLDVAARHAFELGCSALAGRADPASINALLMRRAIFFRRTSAIAQSRSADLMDRVRSGRTFLGGLAGESWSRLDGGDLASSSHDAAVAPRAQDVQREAVPAAAAKG